MACKHPHTPSKMPQYKGHDTRHAVGRTISAARIANIIHGVTGTTLELTDATCSTCGGPMSVFLRKKWLTGDQRHGLAIGAYFGEYTNEHGRPMQAIIPAALLAEEFTPYEAPAPAENVTLADA